MIGRQSRAGTAILRAVLFPVRLSGRLGRMYKEPLVSLWFFGVES